MSIFKRREDPNAVEWEARGFWQFVRHGRVWTPDPFLLIVNIGESTAYSAQARANRGTDIWGSSGVKHAEDMARERGFTWVLNDWRKTGPIGPVDLSWKTRHHLPCHKEIDVGEALELAGISEAGVPSLSGGEHSLLRGMRARGEDLRQESRREAIRDFRVAWLNESAIEIHGGPRSDGHSLGT